MPRRSCWISKPLNGKADFSVSPAANGTGRAGLCRVDMALQEIPRQRRAGDTTWVGEPSSLKGPALHVTSIWVTMMLWEGNFIEITLFIPSCSHK